jgi:polysaccharide pyruvyl transferase WcaK-like protein
MLRRFAEPLCVREHTSAQHLHELLGDSVVVEVTADAALQERYEPFDRAEYFTEDRAALADRFVVAISARDQQSPRYDDAFRGAMVHLHEVRSAHFVLLPQLYGAHSDVAYLRRLAAGLPAGVSWEIVDPTLDSIGQRRVIAMVDLCIAGRYHPQVFAASAGVPGVCIYYEHKALGFMRTLGLEDLCIDAAALDASALVQKVDVALDRSEELAEKLRNREPSLRAAALRTTELATAVLRDSSTR